MALKIIFRTFKNSLPLCSLKSQYFYIYVQVGTKYFKETLKMNTVYFHNELGNDDLEIQLKFTDESLKINKTFIFQRKMSERVELFLKRLNDKLATSFLKKQKKKKENAQCSETLEALNLNPVFIMNNEQIPGDAVFENMISKIDGKNLKLKISSRYFEVLMNCPTITSLSLPECIYVGCPVFPEKFKSKCAKIDDCKFTWFKSKNGKNWKQCSEGYFYIPTTEDLMHLLKVECLPKNNDTVGPVVEVQSQSMVKKHENLFLIEKRHMCTSSRTSEEEIRVVSYNLLADVYATTKEAKNNFFTYCNPTYMQFNYRKDLLLVELSGYNADLLCLQEVDKKMFNETLMPYFNTKGFSGMYIGKKKEGFNEGCAIFSNNYKFRVMSVHQHVLSEELRENPIFLDLKEKVMRNDKLMVRVCGLQTQIQVVALESLTSKDNLILVANAHLYFHPNADHIRLLQGIISFKILLDHKRILEEQNSNKKINVMFCGDFNSSPDCGIYKFFTTGSVTESEVDWNSMPDEAVTNISFSNPLNMKSAYGAPKYTNYTKEFKECLDYIFFQTDNLELKHFVPLPSEEDLSRETAIPSAFFPSDHVALIADLKWKS